MSPTENDGATRPRQMPSLSPFPLPPASFIGRDELVTDLVTALRRPSVRLLTVTGPGGVGKTRLAIEAGEAMRPEFADGVGFVPLAAIENPGMVLPAIAAAMGLPEGDSRSLLGRVRTRLGDQRCLLVLDNFEQVVDAAPVLTQILDACPAVAFLVTSRRVLRISGEHVFPIPPMSLDRGEYIAGSVGLPDLPYGGASEAVRLFVERASAASPSNVWDGGNEEIIAAICERLDGLPLAIELAAARSSLLNPPAMLARLDYRLPLLGTGARDQPTRLQTMRNAITWSYDLLTEDEQEVFRCLSVFVGGFSLAAAAAVCDRDEGSVLAALESLVDHSLVRAMIEITDEPRYTMLETIREFGLDQLAEAGEVDGAQVRHAWYFVELAERIEPKVDGPETSESLRWLDLDRPNLRAALARLIERQETEDALRLAAALWRYWRIRGYLTEGRDGLGGALNLPGHVPPSVRADALWKLGYVLYFLGSYDPARDHYERSVALFSKVEDRSGEATALDSLGLLLRLQGEFFEASDALERSLAIRRELGERLEEEISLANLGMLAVQCGNLREARMLLEEALDIASELGAEREIGHRCLTLARVELEDGRVTTARDLAQRALAIFEGFSDQIAVSMALETLGQATNGLGDHQGGVSYLVASLRLRLKLGLLRGMDTCVEHLANAAVSLDPVVATRLLAAANIHRESIGTDRVGVDAVSWDETNATARAVLGAERFDEASLKGAQLSLIAAGQEAVAAFGQLASSGNVSTGDILGTTPMDSAELNLTPRELEVLRLVASGMTNGEIADTLFISPATTKRHVTHILAKLELSTRAAAISYAHRAGLLDESLP